MKDAKPREKRFTLEEIIRGLLRPEPTGATPYDLNFVFCAIFFLSLLALARMNLGQGSWLVVGALAVGMALNLFKQQKLARELFFPNQA